MSKIEKQEISRHFEESSIRQQSKGIEHRTKTIIPPATKTLKVIGINMLRQQKKINQDVNISIALLAVAKNEKTEPIFRRLIASIVVAVDSGCKHTPLYLTRSNSSSWEYTQHQCWEAKPSILMENKVESNSEQAVELAGRRFCLPSPSEEHKVESNSEQAVELAGRKFCLPLPSEEFLVEHKVEANSEQVVELAGRRFCLSSSSEALYLFHGGKSHSQRIQLLFPVEMFCKNHIGICQCPCPRGD
ncbi:hypothetical protein IV203_032417 [Nitzschia inconspicua]|uniref:Uncharacterized protein n=1 Tax=Nitzschia inconspicua TaxID=303405 RepID=A0A9K3KK18_9STRA|nr:hypothetical protein IV203_032417 [Nitzschia inconspicua]